MCGNSLLVPYTQVEDEDAFDEEVDTLKFRLVLRPETEENNQASSASDPSPAFSEADPSRNGSGSAEVAGAGEGGALPLHRLMIQTVGGRSCSQVMNLCSITCTVVFFRVVLVYSVVYFFLE